MTRERNDTILAKLSYDLLNELNLPLPMIVFYNNKTSDYRGKFVARVFSLGKPSKYIMLAETEQELENKLPRERYFLKRDKHDDANIICSFLI